MVTLHYADPGCVIGHTNDLIVSVWRAGLTRERFDGMVAAGKAARAAHGDVPVGSLSIVVQLPGSVDTQSRELSKDLTVQMAPYSMCGAQVLEGRGLWMTTVRLIIATVQLRNKVPSKVFDRVDDALPWLHEHAKIDVSGATAAISKLRDELGKQPVPTR